MASHNGDLELFSKRVRDFHKSLESSRSHARVTKFFLVICILGILIFGALKCNRIVFFPCIFLTLLATKRIIRKSGDGNMEFRELFETHMNRSLHKFNLHVRGGRVSAVSS